MGGQSKPKRRNKPKRKDMGQNGGAMRMSPQERMKAKMREKAKRKTAEKYTVDQLLEKTEECMDNFDFEMARLYCQRAVDMEPTNLTVLDLLGNICAELGDAEKAKQVFLKSVELSPDEGHSKYMYLGQIHTGIEAVQSFRKGIDVMLNTLDKSVNEGACGSAECLINRKDVSVAFCSIAEIFFTDLCMEDGASERCKESIDKALEFDEQNPEALQLMASYCFSISKTEEGREYLKKSVTSWLPSLQNKAESSVGAESAMDEEEDDDTKTIPPYESRITAAKLLIEVEEFEMATEVLEDLLEEDDEVVQIWYLLGWLFYLQIEKQDTTNNAGSVRKSAWTYLTKAKQLYLKLGCDDTPMFEHTEQLLAELCGDDGLDAGAGPSLEDIDDDFIQSSEDEEEAAMDQ